MNNLTNKDVIRMFFEIYNSKNYDLAYDCMAVDYRDHSLPQVQSLNDALSILKSTHQSFPDIKVVIDDLIEEGNKVTFRGHFIATHLGDFVNIPPSGKQVSFEALEIFTVENQKITESWGYWPMTTILNQINLSIENN